MWDLELWKLFVCREKNSRDAEGHKMEPKNEVTPQKGDKRERGKKKKRERGKKKVFRNTV